MIRKIHINHHINIEIPHINEVGYCETRMLIQGVER